MAKLGTLFLVPNTLGDDARTDQLPWVLPSETLLQTAKLKHWIVEDAKTARALLKAVDSISPLACTIQEMHMSEWRGAARNAKYGDAVKPADLLKPLVAGNDMGLMSEAGVPGVADPGAELVLAAHQLGAQVKPLVGPSSILLGLMASGLNGQRFAFQGYLPHDTHERSAKLKLLEAESRKLQQTQIWIETPYRNTAMLMACLSSLAPQSLLCLGVDLSLTTEMIATLSIADWRKRYPNEAACASLQNRPTVFLLLA
ncbi:SAM-dependent methyltransferase [Polynucleobacter sp. MG-5-Ahmo-C2]|jgi:16S rRNA (cytidine1402-2'-O)-methyltransferase|uniref:SAM-dependent methyltransferase n=1 Tax=Polynucleobacter sp. MG-5-Ahmo-C2 TaxID=2081051 RepID=UPI001BFE6818|nr:SAM-dependent methyltransferase [Polynucleobacter sp. MG-5-Ahmo-C2]QWD98903.1 SAM-dependent methyltransferase [Polynucleobacter sp. MG-5-Ahmo-C2]